MEGCIKLQHLIVFVEEKHGEIIFHCIPCNKDYSQYNDCCAGR